MWRRLTEMGRVVRLLALLAVTCIAVPVVAALGASTARACSCAAIDPIDAVGMADVVFTGSAVSNEGTENEPLWTFDVDGVVKGEVSPVEVVAGEDWAFGCGTDFGRFNEAVVVYAASSGDRLRAMGCMPTPTAEAFAAQLSAISGPIGTGPPVAVMVGTYGLSDFAVLDGRGRTIARAELGLDAGAVAHCRGTSRVAVVSTDGSAPISIVDLETLTVLDERPLRSGFVSVTGDRLACFDGGTSVVATTGYGPNEGSVVVAVSSSAESTPADVRRTFDDISRAVIHPARTVLLLPTVVGDPIRTLSADDLEPTGNDAPLPDGASTLDGDVSPDGSKLAVLATLSGRPVEWDTGATHVITFDLVDGIPVAESVGVVPLTERGEDIESRNGAAKWIRWTDADTWIIESETMNTKMVEFVSTDGAQVLPPTDVGWGWGLVPLDAGALRARNGGLELIARDGTALGGDPAPSNEYVDRFLALDRLVDAPRFEVPTTAVGTLTITPVAVSGGTESDQPVGDSEQVAEPDPEPSLRGDEPSVAESEPSAALVTGSEGDGVVRWTVGGGLVLAILLILGRVLLRRRTGIADVGREPAIR